MSTLSTDPHSLKDTDCEQHAKKEKSNGCPYALNCPYAKLICFEQKPVLKRVSDRHFAACHLAGEVVSVPAAESMRKEIS